jgi:hypothetical protein
VDEAFQPDGGSMENFRKFVEIVCARAWCMVLRSAIDHLWAHYRKRSLYRELHSVPRARFKALGTGTLCREQKIELSARKKPYIDHLSVSLFYLLKKLQTTCWYMRSPRNVLSDFSKIFCIRSFFGIFLKKYMFVHMIT